MCPEYKPCSTYAYPKRIVERDLQVLQGNKLILSDLIHSVDIYWTSTLSWSFSGIQDTAMKRRSASMPSDSVCSNGSQITQDTGWNAGCTMTGRQVCEEGMLSDSGKRHFIWGLNTEKNLATWWKGTTKQTEEQELRSEGGHKGDV